MEDVIFSGTESRKPLGFAYVAITLDNSDHQLAVEYDTVTVSRRVYRSGESEYKINGHNCRLKDVQELFFDTGIGKEGYSIIGQGQIDKILSGKPEERRELFDEAAGIVKYKRRKALTEKNLAEEQQNLSRVRDILYELEKQVGPLEKQSETARIYLKHRDTLKQYDANMYLLSFYQLKKDSAAIDEKMDIVSTQLKDSQENFEKIKSAYAQMEALMEQYDQKISQDQEVCNQQALEKQRLEGGKNVLVSKTDGISSTDAIKGTYLDNYKQIWDLYLNNSTCEPSMISSKTGDDAASEFSLGEAVFYQNGTWAYNDIKDNEVAEEDMGMLPIYIGVDGEENQGLCTGSENYWCVNKNASEEDIQATLDFMKWVVESDEGRDMLANQMGFVTPFTTFADYLPDNPLVKANAEYTEAGKTPVSWNFTTMPSENWKNNLGGALLNYAQGTGTWDSVQTAFVDGWAEEYAAANE